MTNNPKVPYFDLELIDVMHLIRDAVPLNDLTVQAIPALRNAFSSTSSDDELSLEGAYVVSEHIVIDARQGEAAVTFCRPVNANGPAPTILYAHGGGMVAGHRRSNLTQIVSLAATIGANVVSVEYRLAPEYPYPAAIDDCTLVLQWLLKQNSETVDPDQVILAGTSAGGGLVASLALRVRDRGLASLRGLMMFAPMLDARNDSVSARQFEHDGIWNRVSNETAWAAYLGPKGAEAGSDAVPALAMELAGLPSTFIDVGDGETFRDECVAFANALWRSRVHTELHVWAGAFHGFDAMAPAAQISQDAQATRAAWLQRLLRNS